MYNERAEGEDPNLSLFMFHTHLIYKACRTFFIMVLHAFFFVFDCVICQMRLSVDFSTCDVIQVIRKVQILECLGFLN